MLTLKNVSFSYSDQPILQEIDLELSSKKIISLIGLSGSGKSTLFKLITGILNPTSGQILIEGETTASTHSQITFMMQEDLLLPWRSVLDNLTLTLELGADHKDPSLFKGQALDMLKEVGLSGTEDLFPDELSGGMRQRVAIARALLQNRPWILLDEPFGALDAIIREQMYSLLLHIREKYHKTILLITHDFRDALMLSNEIHLLNQGKIAKTWQISQEIKYNSEMMRDIEEDLRQAMSLCSVASQHNS
ncbi:MAG: ssuB2 [Chlamydiales bacterium]|jgi:ABC-type nitrate/sulfonate/bicarbonate transport system ATPase subunit|nr:ssuB2 [Chlamydiales bacterium]